MVPSASVQKIRRFDDSPSSLGIDNIVEDRHVNERELSVRAIISTPRPDKVRHIVNPLGGDFTEYRTNPIVLWEHGLLGGTLSIPIATSADASNRLCVYPSADNIEAKSFFSERNKQSEQFFALIADRIIRATSVRFRPAVAPVVKSGITYYDDWIMEEWSWAAFGVNPDAVAGVVAKGRLAGMPIDPSIFKSLNAQLPKRTAYRIAAEFDSVHKSCCPECKSGGTCSGKEDDPLEKSTMDKESMSTADQVPEDDDDEKTTPPAEGDDSAASNTGKTEPEWRTGEGEPSETEPVYEQGDEAPESAEDGASEEEPDAPSTAKGSVGYGAKMLRATHKALKTIHSNMGGSFGELEHPGVKERLGGVHKQIGEMAEGVAGYFASTYPNLPMEEQENMEEQSMVKSLLAAKPIRRLTLVDVITDLQNLHAEYREPVLKSAVARLSGLLQDARREQESVLKSREVRATNERKETPPQEPPPEVVGALGDARETWSQAASLLKSLTSARRA